RVRCRRRSGRGRPLRLRGSRSPSGAPAACPTALQGRSWAASAVEDVAAEGVEPGLLLDRDAGLVDFLEGSLGVEDARPGEPFQGGTRTGMDGGGDEPRQGFVLGFDVEG